MNEYPWACQNHPKNATEAPKGGCVECYRNMREWLDNSSFTCKTCNEEMPEILKHVAEFSKVVRGWVTIPLWHKGLSYRYECNTCKCAGDDEE